MDEALLDRLGREKYLLVTSFRKDGSAVATPVWAVRDGAAIGVWTAADSWKVKRIRRRADILLGPCDMRGKPTGESVPATAEVLDAEGTAHYRTLLARKYGLFGRLTMLGSRLRRGTAGTVGIRITLSS